MTYVDSLVRHWPQSHGQHTRMRYWGALGSIMARADRWLLAICMKNYPCYGALGYWNSTPKGLILRTVKYCFSTIFSACKATVQHTLGVFILISIYIRKWFGQNAAFWVFEWREYHFGTQITSAFLLNLFSSIAYLNLLDFNRTCNDKSVALFVVIFHRSFWFSSCIQKQ